MKKSVKKSVEISLRFPEKYVIPKKYIHKKDEVALFPKEFEEYDVNDLPLTSGKIEHYYHAENFEGDKWQITTFDKNGDHGGFKTRGTKTQVLNHLTCLAQTEKDDNGERLEKCRKMNKLPPTF